MRARWITVILVLSCLTAPQLASAESASDLNDMALAAYDAEEFRDAIELFSRARDMAPEQEVLTANLAKAHAAYAGQLAMRGSTSEAVSHFLKAQRLAPEMQEAHVGLITVYYNAGERQRAINAIEPYLRRWPKDNSIRELYGELLYRSGKINPAIKQWTRVKKAGAGSESLDERLAKAKREREVEGDFERESSKYFTVRYEGDRMEDAGYRVLRLCREARKDIGRELRVFPKNRVEVILYASEQFDSATKQRSHVAGLYDGKIRIRVPGGPLDSTYLRRVVYHEYVHLAIGELTNHQCPFWLNEGLAQELSEAYTAQHKEKLRSRVASGTLPSAKKLEDLGVYASSASDLTTANLAAFAMAHHLRTRYSSRNLLKMFEELRGGATGEAALEHAYRLSYAHLDDALADTVR